MLDSALHCPHCRAYAEQMWGHMAADMVNGQGRYGTDAFVAKCRLCNKISVWLYEQMIYPAFVTPVKPNDDMPPEVQEYYNEAASILSQSPRAAAALLRLALEELCDKWGAEGKNIQSKIDWLIKNKSISPRIVRMMDTVRITGNEAVHPGMIDLRDKDGKIAIALFILLNRIIENVITEEREEEAIYELLPNSKKRKNLGDNTEETN